MHQKDFVIEIITDEIRRIANTESIEAKPELWAELIYETLTNELEIYVLTKDYVGKLT